MLDVYDFDGTGDYFKVKRPGQNSTKIDPVSVDAARALLLAATLDDYNNGEFCR